jgi:hypothetical protein
LRHRLGEGADYAVYSDMDNEDINIKNSALIRKMQNFGAVFGRSISEGYNTSENSFMGFARQDKTLKLLSDCILNTRPIILKKMNGYSVYRKMIRQFMKVNGIPDEMDISFLSGCPPMSKKIPVNPFYVENGINDP